MRSNSSIWKYSRRGQLGGPVSIDEVRSMIASGDLAPDDLVWSKDIGSWQPVSEVQDALLHDLSSDPPANSAAPPAQSGSSSSATKVFTPHAEQPIIDTPARLGAQPGASTPSTAKPSLNNIKSTAAAWKTSQAGTIRGGLAASAVLDAYQAGELSSEDLVFSNEIGSWQPLGTVVETLRAAVQAEAPAAPPVVEPIEEPPLIDASFSSPVFTDILPPPAVGSMPPRLRAGTAKPPSSMPPPLPGSVENGTDDVGFDFDRVAVPRRPREPLLKSPAVQIGLVLVGAALVVIIGFAVLSSRAPDDTRGLALIAEADALAQSRQFKDAAAKYREAHVALVEFDLQDSAGGKARDRAKEEAERMDRFTRRPPPVTSVAAAPSMPAVSNHTVQKPLPSPLPPPSVVAAAPSPAGIPRPLAASTSARLPGSQAPMVIPQPGKALANRSDQKQEWTYLVATVEGFLVNHAELVNASKLEFVNLPSGYSFQSVPKDRAVTEIEVSMRDPSTLARKKVLLLSLDTDKGSIYVQDVLESFPASVKLEAQIVDRMGRSRGRVLVMGYAEHPRLRAAQASLVLAVQENTRLAGAKKMHEAATDQVSRCVDYAIQLENQYDRATTFAARTEIRRKHEAAVLLLRELTAGEKMAATRIRTVQSDYDSAVREAVLAMQQCAMPPERIRP